MGNIPALRASALGVVVAIATVGHAALAQPARQPAYRTQTELVRVTATVTDAEGRAITTLQREDFTVSEDNAPQDIALFTHDVDTPLSIVIALDVSGSMKEELDTVRAGLHAYVEALHEDDEVGLVTFGFSVHRVSGLTAPRAQLLAALNDVSAGGGTALYAGIVEAAHTLETARHQKKVLLLVTDGNNSSLRSSKRAATRAAQQSEAMVYALAIGHAGRDSLRGRIVAAMTAPQMSLLRGFADASGGRAALVDDVNGAGRADVVGTIQEFGDELRQQYTIGYYPPARHGGNAVHQIRVTTRRADAMVRARTLYLSAPP